MANILSGPDPMEEIPRLLSLTDITEDRMGQIAVEAEDEVLRMAKNLGISLNSGPDREIEQGIALEIKDRSFFLRYPPEFVECKGYPLCTGYCPKGIENSVQCAPGFFLPFGWGKIHIDRRLQPWG